MKRTTVKNLALMLALAAMAGTVTQSTLARAADDDEEEAAPKKKKKKKVDAEEATAAATDAAAKMAAAPASAAPAIPIDGTPDHDYFEGHMGVGWYGLSSVPLGGSGALIDAPVIGARYWLDKGKGVDVGLGFFTASGKDDSNNGGTSNSKDRAAPTVIFLHAGVPFVLGEGKHHAFLVTPEVNFGMANQTVKGQNNDPDTKLSGTRIEAGARAGMEIHFGFLSIPNLALEGSVGLFYTALNGKTEQGNVSQSYSQTIITTSSFNQPWDFFRSNVAARYYF